MTSEVPSTIWGWSTADTRNELGRRACDLHFPVLMPQGERVTEFSHSASEIQALVHVLNGKTRGNAASILHQYKSRGWKPRGQRTAWMNEQQGWIVGTLGLNALRSLLKCDSHSPRETRGNGWNLLCVRVSGVPWHRHSSQAARFCFPTAQLPFCTKTSWQHRSLLVQVELVASLWNIN